jgi:hypothetical protein
LAGTTHGQFRQERRGTVILCLAIHVCAAMENLQESESQEVEFLACSTNTKSSMMNDSCSIGRDGAAK